MEASGGLNFNGSRFECREGNLNIKHKVIRNHKNIIIFLARARSRSGIIFLMQIQSVFSLTLSLTIPFASRRIAKIHSGDYYLHALRYERKNTRNMEIFLPNLHFRLHFYGLLIICSMLLHSKT